MISLKRLLQEQGEEEFVFTDEFTNELKKAINQEPDPVSQAITSTFYDALFPDKTAIYTVAAVLLVIGFKKQIISTAGKIWKSGYNPVRIVGKQLAILAPMKAFLQLNADGAAEWTRNAILKPLQRIQLTYSPSSDMYKSARQLERQINSNMDPADFMKLAMATRKLFYSKTYNALSKLRNSEGYGPIAGDLQNQFEKLFVELNKINPSIFDERYIRTTLTSLDIKPYQIDDILANAFPNYRAPMKPSIVTPGWPAKSP